MTANFSFRWRPRRLCFTSRDALLPLPSDCAIPSLIGEAQPRLQAIPGAQVATMAEMMGTFLNLMGAVRTLVMAVAIVAVTISALSVFNTMLTSVLERTGELGIMRAVGASRGHVFGLLTLEALLLTSVGSVAGSWSRLWAAGASSSS